VSLEVEQSTAELKIELVESTGDTCYVALSHVWADGLGNPFGNALPKCQLLALQTLAQEVGRASETDGPVLLWLDTLCVPCEPGAGKTVAMGMMRRTYEEAHHVLVLESSLRCWDTESSDLIETAVRIFTSPWLRRLWCLQEGAFAKRLWFQFQDRPVELAEIFGEFRAVYQSRNFSQKEIVFSIMSIYKSLRLFVRESPNLSMAPPITLDTILLALRYRGVSVASDEPICLVNLFDIDANILIGQDGGTMPRFWRALCESQRVPRSIVFFQGPKLHDEGFRWAPATLLGAERLLPLIRPDYLEPATFSQKGLMVRFPGVVISRPVFDIIPLVFNKRNGLPDLWHLFEHRKDRWYGFGIKSADVQTCIFGEDASAQASMLKQGNAFAIIFSHDPNVQQRKPLKKPQAMFISIKAHEDGVYHGRLQGEVNFITRNSGECSIFNRAHEIAQSLPRDELVKVLFQVKDMEDSKKSEALTPIVEALLAKATQAAEEALQEPAFRSIHDANVLLEGTAQFILAIWNLYTQRLTLVNQWLPDDTVWCVD
jgi:Heterokaryon incompatibility protein (HET)